MSAKTKISIITTTFLVSIFLIIPLSGILAQEESTTTSSEEAIEQEVQAEIQKEEEVLPQDLEIKEPGLLPDSPFYFVKNWWRGLQLAFTFDPVKKAQLREKFANEKLLELKKLAEKKKDPKIIEKARRNYEKELEALKSGAKNLQKVKDKKKVEPFLDKFIRHQILHQKILEKLENQVPPQAFEKIKGAREKHLERFKDVMLKLEDKEKLPERLEKIVEKMKGSDFKEIKALEILRRVEEEVEDENAKEAIQKARERILKKAKEKLEKLPKRRRLILRRFIEKLPGDKEKQLEILEDLRQKLKNNPDIKKDLEQGRKRILKRIIEKRKEILKKKGCPLPTLPDKDFCKEGRIMIRKDKNGCPEFICVNPLQIKNQIQKKLEKLPKKKFFCIEVWDPVCGEDGKTYPNACFAKVAGVKIAHKGVCENDIPKCAKEGEKVNRNPLLGPTNRVCCPGLIEKRVSRSYSICVKPENANFSPIIIQKPTTSIPIPPSSPEEPKK